jgi:hypothetical protein
MYLKISNEYFVFCIFEDRIHGFWRSDQFRIRIRILDEYDAGGSYQISIYDKK